MYTVWYFHPICFSCPLFTSSFSISRTKSNALDFQCQTECCSQIRCGYTQSSIKKRLSERWLVQRWRTPLPYQPPGLHESWIVCKWFLNGCSQLTQKQWQIDRKRWWLADRHRDKSKKEREESCVIGRTSIRSKREREKVCERDITRCLRCRCEQLKRWERNHTRTQTDMGEKGSLKEEIH